MHHDDDGRNCGHGRQGVHDNAQLAMIGVGLVRVQMRYLRYREQGQEDKAQNCDDRQKARPIAPLDAEKCLKSCQYGDLDILILQKNAFVWTVIAQGGCLR